MGSDPNALLLERDAELEAVEAALTAAAAGSGRLVLVEGPAGKGKTALLAAARHRARRAGIRVLAARGSELERDVPFGLALELFGRPLQAARPADRQALFRGAAQLAAPPFSSPARAFQTPGGAPCSPPEGCPGPRAGTAWRGSRPPPSGPAAWPPSRSCGPPGPGSPSPRRTPGPGPRPPPSSARTPSSATPPAW